MDRLSIGELEATLRVISDVMNTSGVTELHVRNSGDEFHMKKDSILLVPETLKQISIIIQSNVSSESTSRSDSESFSFQEMKNELTSLHPSEKDSIEERLSELEQEINSKKPNRSKVMRILDWLLKLNPGVYVKAVTTILGLIL